MLRVHDGLYNVLKKVYPEFPWQQEYFSRSYWGKTQWILYVIVKRLFPNLQVALDYAHPKMRFPDSQQKMQLDVYVPSLSLALEYQGQQHYEVCIYVASHVVV